MPETYPSDAILNALSGTADSEQEVRYPAIFESPYYTSFYKMLHRLLDVSRRAGDLRVFQDGDRTCGVRAGRFFDGDTERVFAGASEQPLTDDAVNYVYLGVDGALAISVAGFPTPSATPHIRLATIATGVASADGISGQYAHDDITDRRGPAFLSPADGGIVPAERLADSVADAIAAITLTPTDNGDGTGSLAVQVVDVQGSNLAAAHLVRVWVGAADDYGADAIDDVSVTTGVQKQEIAADAEILVVTDSDGLAVLDLDNGGAGTLYAWAELGGRVVASGAIAITA